MEQCFDRSYSAGISLFLVPVSAQDKCARQHCHIPVSSCLHIHTVSTYTEGEGNTVKGTLLLSVADLDLGPGLPGPWPIHQNWQLILFMVKSLKILPAQLE